MSDDENSDILDELARAARGRDWNRCRNLTGALLARLPADAAAEVARAQVAARLPFFERHHPTEQRPRTLLASLTVATGGGEPLDRSAWGECEGPGGNSYIGAIEALLETVRAGADQPRRVAMAVEAIASAIMAEKVAGWGGRHPDLWQLWYREGLSGEPRTKPDLLASMANDPDAAAADTAGWLAVESELRHRLTSGR